MQVRVLLSLNNKAHSYFSVKFLLRHYKFLKIKTDIKKNKILLFYNTNDFDSKIWFAAEKLFKILSLKHHKLQNRITKKVFDLSIFKRFRALISGSIISIILKVLPHPTFSTFSTIHNTLTFFGLKFNRAFYLSNQTRNVVFIKYRITVILFTKLMTNIVRFPFFEIM